LKNINFGTAKSGTVKTYLQEKSHKEGITIDEVDSRMRRDKTVPLKAVSAVMNSKFRVKLDKIVGKPKPTED
jgi:hypothetical protein